MSEEKPLTTYLEDERATQDFFVLSMSFPVRLISSISFGISSEE